MLFSLPGTGLVKLGLMEPWILSFKIVLGENEAFDAQIYALGARVRSFEGCLGFEHPIAAWVKFSPPGRQDPRYANCWGWPLKSRNKGKNSFVNRFHPLIFRKNIKESLQQIDRIGYTRGMQWAKKYHQLLRQGKTVNRVISVLCPLKAVPGISSNRGEEVLTAITNDSVYLRFEMNSKH